MEHVPAHRVVCDLVDERFKDIIMEHEIPEKLARRLRVLADYDIILLCDDSGSMNTLIDGTQRTRWDELKSYVEIILDVATIFHPNGIDTFFLNRPHLTLHDRSQVDEAFAARPKGVTPIVDTLRPILASQRNRSRKTLIFIATDGAPTDRQGNINVDVLKKVMNEERQVATTFVTFLICTDDNICVDYLNDWDETMVNVDVVDDFRTERAQIWQEQGRHFRFSKGEYIVKALIGAIDSEIGQLDGKKRS